MTERRAHPRYDLRFGAEVKTAAGSIEAATHDVSRGGCRLESSRPLEEGAVVEVSLVIMIDGVQDPDYPHLATRAAVRWCAEAGAEGEPLYLAGVEFQDLPPAQGDWLERVLRRMSGE